jgi:hypothetical protein
MCITALRGIEDAEALPARDDHLLVSVDIHIMPNKTLAGHTGGAAGLACVERDQAVWSINRGRRLLGLQTMRRGDELHMSAATFSAGTQSGRLQHVWRQGLLVLPACTRHVRVWAKGPCLL